MDDERMALCQYRLEKAKEDFEVSKLNFKESFFKASINRSYYSIFHATRALLALDSYDSKKHSGIIAYFNKNYIKTGKLDKKFSKIISKASNIRNESDYNDFFIASKDEAFEQLKDAEYFIDGIEKFIKEI